jgi:hypothetical protein
MDSSFTVKPRDNVARTAVGRSNSVRTDLSPSQSVNAAQQASALHHAPVEPAAREPALDPQCHTVLDREREQRERRRARKDEVLLRQKAYGRSVDKPDLPQDDAQHADFEV